MTHRQSITGILTSSLILLSLLATGASGEEALQSFSTGGHTVYHLRCGRIAPTGDGVLFAAALDGSVLCLTKQGKLLWKNQANRSLPLDLEVADIDGDGKDEALVAAADGNLYALDHTGKLLWRFSRVPPLLQVCAITKTSRGTVILTGGIEKKLYALSPDGKVLGFVEYPNIVRHIRSGKFLEGGKECAAVLTVKTDKNVSTLRLIDPANLKPVWKKPVVLKTDNPTKGTKYFSSWLSNRVPIFSLLAVDIDHDGTDEMLLSNDYIKLGIFYAFNHQGKKILTSSSKGLRKRPYRMNLLTHVKMPNPDNERIFGLFGNQIVVYDLEGSIKKIVDGPYSLACAEFDPENQTLFLGSSISGGDGIYALRLDHPDSGSAFENLKPVGRLAQVEKNMAMLAKQVERFKRPAYQRPPKKTSLITGRSADDIQELYLDEHNYNNAKFIQFNLFTEDFDRETLQSPWNKKRESRRKYNYTAKRIIEFAAEREKRKEPFAMWAGHGNDPFYVQLSTIEGILKAAPTMARAFIFAEMEQTDEAMEYALQTQVIPIAKLCQKHGTAKVILRNKNIFWNASCYLDLWKKRLLSKEYSDVFVPSMEETNGRTQAISLSGRTGLWLCGYFDHVSARAVTDNANFSRLWEWSSQQKLSHLMRSMALRSSLGADILLVNIYQGDPKDLTPLYRMLEKGVIAIPEREELLSVADLCLGMKTPSPAFMEQGKNGHFMNQYQPGKPAMVFDRMACYWGAAPTASSDFSNYAMGSRSRMLNFLPTNPYGLIASVPADIPLDQSPFFNSMLITDGEFFYDKKGNKISAVDYKPQAMKALRESADRLAVRVIGEVSWTVVRLDPTHIRVTLIDPGYVSPADREAKIVLQHLEAANCRDILSGESLPLVKNSTTLTVPAGILRIVDITHK